MSWLAAIDMDGTILKDRTIDVLARTLKFEEKLAEIDTKYKDLNESEKSERIATFFKGFQASRILEIFRKIPLSNGIEELINYLNQKKFIVSIVTNSYTFLAEDLAKRIGIKRVFGNVLEVKNGIITGKITMPLNWAKTKDCKCHSICKFTVVKEFAEENNIPNSRILAIGDSENDYCMLKLAQIAVAYRSKSKRLKKIPNIIISDDFHDVLNILKEKLEKI
ncbi:MAG: HAD family hydrolase [Candidatus Helarchaeota archaeon]